MNTPTVFILDGDGESGRACGTGNALPRVSGRPFLLLQLEWLARKGFTNLFFVSNRTYSDFPDCRNGSWTGDMSIRCRNFGDVAAFGAGGEASPEDTFETDCLFIESSVLFDIPLDWLINYRRTSLPKGSVCVALKYSGIAGKGPCFSVRPDWTVSQISQTGNSQIDGYVYGGIIAADAGLVRDIFGRADSSRNALLLDLMRAERLFGVPFGGKYIDTGLEETLRMSASPIGDWIFRGKAPALFLDRDGILVRDTGYVWDPNTLVFKKSFFELSRMAQDRGFLIVVLSNQAGVAKGLMTVGDVERVNAKILEEFARYGVEPAAIYWCPYHENGVIPEWTGFSLLRKPEPGMALRAMEEHPIDPLRSIMIGDRDTDRIRLPYLRTFLVPERYPVDDLGDVTDICRIEEIIRSY